MTTDPAQTMAPRPIETPLRIVDPNPIQTLLPISTRLRESSCRVLLSEMCAALRIRTPISRKSWSSRPITPTLLEINTPSPISPSHWIVHSLPIMTSSPISRRVGADIQVIQPRWKFLPTFTFFPTKRNLLRSKYSDIIPPPAAAERQLKQILPTGRLNAYPSENRK